MVGSELGRRQPCALGAQEGRLRGTSPQPARSCRDVRKSPHGARLCPVMCREPSSCHAVCAGCSRGDPQPAPAWGMGLCHPPGPGFDSLSLLGPTFHTQMCPLAVGSLSTALWEYQAGADRLPLGAVVLV